MPTNKQRREAARRHLERQLQARQEREAAQKRRTLIATIAGTVVLALIVVGVVVATTHDSKKSKAAAASGTPTSSSTASASSTAPTPEKTNADGTVDCKFTSGGPAARKVSVPVSKETTKGSVVTSVQTTQGAMTFTMNRAAAPCTVASFASLVKQKYYNNTPCHRLTTSGIFVLQCGDPTGKGTGGPGYTIPDEYKGTEKYTSGVIAMANTGAANSGGGQFFIVYKDTPLPASYTVFGTVSSGMAVVQKVAKAGSNNSNATGDGAPKLAIKLTTLTVE